MSTSSAPLSVQRKQRRHWSLIRILCRPGQVAAQGFQAVAWRIAQVDQVPGRVQHCQLPAGLAFDGAKPADRFVLSETFGIAASKAADHWPAGHSVWGNTSRGMSRSGHGDRETPGPVEQRGRPLCSCGSGRGRPSPNNIAVGNRRRRAAQRTQHRAKRSASGLRRRNWVVRRQAVDPGVHRLG